jgi:hypothetical protein
MVKVIAAIQMIKRHYYTTGGLCKIKELQLFIFVEETFIK